ncbi:hypothetical protein DRJ19_04320 [Candidatus Woesearchaeota archaeon]|nr:MAG: hypothetical protein DRJ19_04320 [Candidatus Woesearchaeota archaeon]
MIPPLTELNEYLYEKISDMYKQIKLVSETIKKKIPHPEIYHSMLEKLRAVEAGLKEFRKLMSFLYEKATIDSVTQLKSRTCLDDYLLTLESVSNLAFIIGDVDKFGDYNKEYGHHQGDIALRYIAQQFKETIEACVAEDEVSFVARYGGEEFCAFIKYYQRDLSALESIAEEVRRSIENLEIPSIPGATYKDENYKHRTITIAAGIRKNHEPIETFMREVSNLLTKKVTEGRNKVYLRR